MAYTTPLTAVLNATLTSAQWNASVRDNFLETAPAKATTTSSHFVGTGANGIAERRCLGSAVDTSETTTSTSFTDLATPGPSAVMTTGPSALVMINCALSNSLTNTSSASYEITGATTQASSTSLAIQQSGTAGAVLRMGVTNMQAVTAGSNTFNMQYLVSAGTGTFLRRRITVMAF